MKMDGSINSIVDMATSQGNSIKTNSLKSKADDALKGKNDEELKEACKQFENYFIEQMMKEMRNTLSKDNEDALIPKGKGETMFTEMRDSQYSKEATENGGIGLAKMLYTQLKKSNS
ncbi:MAG TPA: flagellar biosynthesis protein FlgJ [Clostridiales bacterium]|nr:MAG: hypothetical protein A2Y22_09325 [Clostridiales bacterium GWD2_32_59]HAN10141.1 flagellar biosynthesis protein FlgJ [Clostridiales bacterium]